MNQADIKNGVIRKTTFEKTLTGEILIKMSESEKENAIKNWLASPVLELEEYILTNYLNKASA
tara:strand:+ start:272 stop:460 length:189 start_codon:yes stop_codon:yes gene_type:complete